MDGMYKTLKLLVFASLVLSVSGCHGTMMTTRAADTGFYKKNAHKHYMRQGKGPGASVESVQSDLDYLKYAPLTYSRDELDLDFSGVKQKLLWAKFSSEIEYYSVPVTISDFAVYVD